MRSLVAALAVLAAALPLHASNDIAGTVVDTAAKPIAAAHVSIYAAYPRTGVGASCPTCYRDCAKHQAVAADGGFRLQELDRGLLFDVIAVADGYQPALVARVDPASGPVKIELTKRSAEEADRLVSGKVLDAEGKPVSGAVITPRGYHMPEGPIAWGTYPGVEKLAITDPKGEFSLRLPSAKGKLDVLVQGRALGRRLARDLAPGQPREIRLADGVTISGHLVQSGKPVAGARIVVVQQDRRSSDFLGRDEVATNDDGLFVVTNVPPKTTWLVYAAMDAVNGGFVEPKVVTTGDDGSTLDAGTLEVQRGRHVAGTIDVPAGREIPANAVLMVYDFRTDDIRRVPLTSSAFAIDDAPLDELQLTVSGNGIPSRALAAKVEAGNDCLDVRIAPARGR